MKKTSSLRKVTKLIKTRSHEVLKQNIRISYEKYKSDITKNIFIIIVVEVITYEGLHRVESV